MTKKTDLVKKQEVANIEARKSDVGMGSQNVGHEDMSIPRLKIVQKQSPIIDENEDAKPGMYHNSVTGQLSTSVYVVNLHFAKSWVIWKKLDMGGGIIGTFPSEEDANAYLEDNKLPVEQFDVVDTPTHLVLIINEDGEPQGVALLDMPSTKAGISRLWNSRIHEQERQGNPRFGCVWELSSALEERNQNKYYNARVELVATVGDELYDIAKAAYDSYFAMTERAATEATDEESAA